jgi:hypothetical protein
VNHLPFIAGSYALALAVPAWLGIGAWTRLARARRRLAAIDARAERMGARP